MILNYFRQFYFLFKDYKKSFIKYSVLSVFAAFFELFGVALTYPFVLKLMSDLGSGIRKSTIVIGLAIVCMFLLKNLYMILYTYIQADFLGKFEYEIKKRIMNFFLCANYQNTSNFSLAEKNKIFYFLIPSVINNFLLRLLNLNINILIFVFIAGCISIKFPIAMLIAVLGGLLLLLIQNKLFHPLLNKVSNKVSQINLINNQAFNDVMLNLKEIKISNNERYFYKKYLCAINDFFKINKFMNFLTQVAPYIVEPFAIILLFILLIMISISEYSSPDKLIASCTLTVTAIFRLTPAISRIQTHLNGINSVLPVVKEFIDFYSKYDIQNQTEIATKSFVGFENQIEIKNVDFSYVDGKKVLRNVNFKINKGEFIGIAGQSGAGKTTLIDLVAGLYVPDNGDIIFDGKSNKSVKIGYIPQEFSLTSGTIRDNVAFGFEKIDDEKVIKALKMAQLYDFIEQNYEKGIYEAHFTDSIGLSLGQRQRIAIARALYSDSDILILDEATSSLDLKTEDEIAEVLKGLKGQKTILVIAHRLSTIKNADRIIYMEDGLISEVAPYKELIEKSEGFRNLTKIASK